MTQRKDVIGKTFKHLEVIEITTPPETVKNKDILYYLCKCVYKECGNLVKVTSNNIGKQSTCKKCSGVVHSGVMKTHGLKKHWLYHRWDNMKRRCLDPKNDSYDRYGRIGVKICERWLGPNGFQNFYDDLYELHPNLDELMELGYTLDRYPNKNGNYEPGNVRYASKKEQANNTKANVIVKHKDTDDTLHQTWDKAVAEGNCSISYTGFHHRVHDLGWSIEKALAEPDHNKRNNEVGLKIYEKWKAGGVMMKDLAVEFDVSKATITHWIQVYKARNAV